MSNELVPFQDQERMANAIAKSGLFGMKDPVAVLALMAVAQAEGRHPASVAKDYHLIQGRPALKADAMLARFQKAGGMVQWTKYTDDVVTGVFSHPQGGSLEVSWTLAQAKAIGLATKDNWRLYPRAMLRARVISEGIRSVYPGVIVGEYTPEEVGDFKEVQGTPIIDVPPPPQMELAAEVEEDGIPIYVPDGDSQRIYSYAADSEEWLQQYELMIKQIESAKKLSEAERAEKASAFRIVNKETYATITGEA
jgi:hypothetical protein